MRCLEFDKVYFAVAVLLFVLEVAIAQTSGFVRHTLGDYCVVMLMYAALRAFVRLPMGVACAVVLVLAYVVELVQLTGFLALVGLENNGVANIIFGNTFSVMDLVAYTLGVMTVWAVEWLVAAGRS